MGEGTRRRNLLLTDKSNAHEPARGMWLELKEPAHFVVGQVIDHLFLLKIELRTPNVQLRKGSRAGSRVGE